MTPILYHRRKTGLHRHDVGLQRRIAGVICRVVSLQWLNASPQRHAADQQCHNGSIIRGKSSLQRRIGRLHWPSASVFHGIAGLNDSPKDRRAGWTDGMESNT